jgi:hypothetical protein
MPLGTIGSGRMGGNRASRPMNEGRECMVYNRQAPGVNALQRRGVVVASSLADRIARLTAPRPIGLMVPVVLPPGVGSGRPSLAGKVAMALPNQVICIAVRRVPVPSSGWFTTGSSMA